MKSIIILCALSGALAAAFAQEPPGATLRGRVVDPSNAGVPHLPVQARNIDTDETATEATDPQGNYAFPDLRPGEYRLSVEAAGFEKFTRDRLALKAGQTVTIDVNLRIRVVTGKVTVTAKAPELESLPETETRNFQEIMEIWQARESSAKDLGEALAQLEGLWKVRKGGIGNDVVLRGFQQDNINLLVDGLRVYPACPNSMDPSAFHVDFTEVQRVEVTKGPFDVKDQGSLGGAIRVISKAPARGLHITPTYSTGSFGYQNPAVTASLANEEVGGSLGYSFRRSDPYTDGHGRPFTAYANYRSLPTGAAAFDINTAWLKFGASPWKQHRLDLSYTRQEGGRTLSPYLLADDVYNNTDRASASYHVDNLSKAIRNLRMQSYFSRVKHYMTDELRTSSVGAPRSYSMATFAESRVLGGRVEAESSDFTAGFEGYRRSWNALNTMRMSGLYGNQPMLPDVTVSVAGLYGEYRRLLFNRLWVNAGGRLDTAKSEARSRRLNTDLYWAYKGTRDLSATDTNPSGSAWLAYPVGKGLEIFAGLGHTVRLPDPRERYFVMKRMGADWVGNPDLRPTENTEGDFGLNYRNRRFSIKPTVFYSYLPNYVTVHNQPRVNPVPNDMNTAARSYENVQAKMYGGELLYSVALSRAFLFHGGISYTRGTKEPKPVYNIRDRDLAEMPPLKSRAALRYGTKVFFGEVEALAVHSQTRVDSDLREQPTPGYAIVSLKAGLHARRLKLAAGIDNLLDRFYYEYFSFQRDPFRLATRVPEPGRSLYLSVAYVF